jgi:uncharacterized protein (TIGR02145 family)
VIACCNNHQYTKETEFCYVNNIYRRCEGKEYDPETEFCGSDKVYPKCGISPYDPATQFCLGSSVYNKCGGREYNPSYERCGGDVVETRCGTGGSYYNPLTEFCNGNSVYPKCGTGDDYYNPATQFCHTDNTVHYKCNGNNYDASAQYCSNGTLKDYDFFTYEGKTYKTVVIGTQTWMAENLNYNVSGSRCSEDDTGGDSRGNCAKYGRLYNWATAMARPDCGYYDTCCGNVQPRGICPQGWHIPSEDDWDTLTDYVGGSSTAGTKLKAASGWNVLPGIPTGTDDYGFAALPGGCGTSGGNFYDAGHLGYWWSSTEYCAYGAYGWDMHYNNENVYRRSFGGNFYLISVRCLKD